MRALLVVFLYLMALFAATGGAAYVSDAIGERSLGNQTALVPGSNAYKAYRLQLMTWGIKAGALVFLITHALGYMALKGRMDEDNPLIGLWLLLGSTLIAAIIGGAFGAMLVG